MDERPSNFGNPKENERIDHLRQAMYSRSLSEKLKERERHEFEPTKPLVGDDWRRGEKGVPVTMAAPRAIQYVRYGVWALLGLSFAFFIGAVGYFMYFFFIGAGSVAAPPSNIDIAVAGPPQVTSGQATELQIVVTNRNPVSLVLSDLVITYPEGTRSPTDYSTDLPSQRISLGNIGPGSQRQGTVTAVFSGKEGNSSVVKVELEYRLAGSSAIFVADANYAVKYSSSPLALAVDGNTQVISGQPVQFNVQVSSNATAPVKDALLKVDYPFGFKFKSAFPEPNESGLWEVGDINPGAKRTIVIEGALAGESADERIFNFTVGTRRTEDSQSIDFPLSTYPFKVTIAQPFIGLAISVNKANSQTVVVSPGENVNVAIGWQNNLSTAVTDAVIVAKLSGVTIDGVTVRSTDGFYRSSDETMIWDKSTSNGALSSMPPGSRGTVGFSFQMPTADVIGLTENPHLDISVNASGNRVSEKGVPENLQSTTYQKIALASSLQLVGQGLYYQNPFGGTGPMPPQAGAETGYALVFTVNNTSNRITAATLTGTLPPYVRYAGHWAPKAESITLNPINNIVTWDVGTIEPGVGLNGAQPRQVAVQIGFTPSTSQIGEQPALINNVTLTGRDESTGKQISVKIPDVTTNLALPSKSAKGIQIGTDKGFVPAYATVIRGKIEN